MSNTETSDVQDFFERAAEIKAERGVNYDSNGKSAYDIALYPFDEHQKFISGIWPVSQKTARLVTLAQKANKGEFDAEAMNDTLLDLVNYAAMYWLKFVKPELHSGDEIIVPVPKSNHVSESIAQSALSRLKGDSRND